MWINSKRLLEWAATAMDRTSAVQTQELTQLRARLERVEGDHEFELAENRTLRERLIDAAAAARAAQMRADLITIRCNQLQSERDQYLQKLWDPSLPVAIVTPEITTRPIVAPTVDFEDAGDGNADVERDGLHPMPAAESLEGLGGAVFDPTRDALGLSGFSDPPEYVP